MNDEEILIKEHEELIQLFIHEDKLAWDLISYFIVVNIGILSVMAVLLSQNSVFSQFIFVALSVVGGVFGLFWFTVRRRSEKHRNLVRDKTREIEAQLKNVFIKFDALGSCEGGTIGKRGVLDCAELIIVIISVIWFCVALILTGAIIGKRLPLGF